jgi:hypothetical protein
MRLIRCAPLARCAAPNCGPRSRLELALKIAECVLARGSASRLIQRMTRLVNSFRTERNTRRSHPSQAAEQVKLNQGAAQQTIMMFGSTSVQ